MIGADDRAGNFSTGNLEVLTAFLRAGDLFHQNQPYVTELLERGVRILIYAGTFDMACNWVGNERWTLDLEWSVKRNLLRSL